MSGAVTVIGSVAELLAGLLSCVAPVVPVTVTFPAVVGVPDTGQLTVAPAGTLLPALQVEPAGLMVQVPTVTSAGRPVTPQAAPLAASAPPLLVQLKLPA